MQTVSLLAASGDSVWVILTWRLMGVVQAAAVKVGDLLVTAAVRVLTVMRLFDVSEFNIH